MHELVVRLTRSLELVVETPHELGPQTVGFLQQLIDAMPFGIVVVGSEREILFANRRVTSKTGPDATLLSGEWLGRMGMTALTEKDLYAAFGRMLGSKPGSVETLAQAQGGFLVMTPLMMVRPDGNRKLVALAVCSESPEDPPEAAGR